MCALCGDRAAISMIFGVCLPNYGRYSVDDLRRLALEAEALGYDSVWMTDHILMSEGSGTPYEQILESLCCMAYLAPITERVKLGVSSLIIAMRNPVVAAKQLATIDCLSSGRVMMAIGAGWNEREFSSLGSPFHERGKRVDESMNLIRALWSGERAFEGRNLGLSFTEAVFEPRPLQKRLTMWVGGTSDAAMRRAITLGDAWHPNAYPLEQFERMVARFRDMPGGEGKEICVRIGLDSRSERSEYVGSQGERRIMLSGNRKENERIVQSLESLGVSYIILGASPDGKVPVATQVDGIRMMRRSA